MPAENIVESIVVNIADLHLGKSIHVKELTLPTGVKIMGDPERVVVHVVSPRKEAEPGWAKSLRLSQKLFDGKPSQATKRNNRPVWLAW